MPNPQPLTAAQVATLKSYALTEPDWSGHPDDVLALIATIRHLAGIAIEAINGTGGLGPNGTKILLDALADFDAEGEKR